MERIHPELSTLQSIHSMQDGQQDGGTDRQTRVKPIYPPTTLLYERIIIRPMILKFWLCWSKLTLIIQEWIDGLMQNRHNSSALKHWSYNYFVFSHHNGKSYIPQRIIIQLKRIIQPKKPANHRWTQCIQVIVTFACSQPIPVICDQVVDKTACIQELIRCVHARMAFKLPYIIIYHADINIMLCYLRMTIKKLSKTT